MKKTLSALILALLVALAPTAAFAKQGGADPRYGTGNFTVGPATMPASGCINHPYRVDVNIGYETDGWFIDVTIAGPNGVADSWVSDVYWDDWGPSYWQESVLICAPGTYTISGNLHSVNNGSSTVVEQALTPATFTVNDVPVVGTSTSERPTAVSLRSSVSALVRT